jgi:hypothetical protein
MITLHVAASKGLRIMVTISIQTEEATLKAIKEIAERKQTTVEEVAQEALQQYLQSQTLPAPSYSFIGIGHSGKRSISTQVEAVLAETAHRREGWSLVE